MDLTTASPKTVLALSRLVPPKVAKAAQAARAVQAVQAAAEPAVPSSCLAPWSASASSTSTPPAALPARTEQATQATGVRTVDSSWEATCPRPFTA